MRIEKRKVFEILEPFELFHFNFVLSDIPAGYPRIVDNPRLKAVQKDHPAVLACRATAEGQDLPNIYWLKDYKPVDTNDPRIKMSEDGIIFIYCFTYSKTCVKLLLNNRQNKDFNDKW